MDAKCPLPGSLAAMAIAHIRQLPYWYLSVAIHAVAIALLSYFFVGAFDRGERYVQTDAQQQQIVNSLQDTSQLNMQKNIADMAKIKQLLEQSLGQSSPQHSALAEDDLKNKTPGELLAEAEKLSAAIATIQAGEKAKELAALLDISQEDALEKIKKAAAPAVDVEHKPALEDKVATELAPLVDRLRQQANDALIEREQQLAKTEKGVKLNSDSGAASKGQGKGSGESDGARTGGHNSGGQHGDPDKVLPAENAKLDISNFLYGDMPRPPEDAAGDHVVFNQGSGYIPALDQASLHKGDGLVLGAGGEFSNRFYLNRWHIIGPFDGRLGRGFSTRKYPPEEAVNLKGVYPGKDDRLLSWQYFIADAYPLVPPDFEEGAVYYGYTELMLDQDSDLWVWIGADDSARIWVNDYLVYEGENIDKGWYFDQVYFGSKQYRKDWNFTEAKQLMHFKKGRNKIMFRLFNSSMNGFFAMVLSK